MSEKQIGNRHPPRTAWKAGQSGNPHGRPRKPDSLAEELRAILASRAGKVTRQRRVAEALVGKAESGDSAALRLLFAYVLGLPVEKVEDVTPREDWPLVRVALFRILGGHPDVRQELLEQIGGDL